MSENNQNVHMEIPDEKLQEVAGGVIIAAMPFAANKCPYCGANIYAGGATAVSISIAAPAAGATCPQCGKVIAEASSDSPLRTLTNINNSTRFG